MNLNWQVVTFKKVVLWVKECSSVIMVLERGSRVYPGKTLENYEVSRSSCGHWNS